MDVYMCMHEVIQIVNNSVQNQSKHDGCMEKYCVV